MHSRKAQQRQQIITLLTQGRTHKEVEQEIEQQVENLLSTAAGDNGNPLVRQMYTRRLRVTSQHVFSKLIEVANQLSNPQTTLYLNFPSRQLTNPEAEKILDLLTTDTSPDVNTIAKYILRYVLLLEQAWPMDWNTRALPLHLLNAFVNISAIGPRFLPLAEIESLFKERIVNNGSITSDRSREILQKIRLLQLFQKEPPLPSSDATNDNIRETVDQVSQQIDLAMQEARARGAPGALIRLLQQEESLWGKLLENAPTQIIVQLIQKFSSCSSQVFAEIMPHFLSRFSATEDPQVFEAALEIAEHQYQSSRDEDTRQKILSYYENAITQLYREQNTYWESLFNSFKKITTDNQNYWSQPACHLLTVLNAEKAIELCINAIREEKTLPLAPQKARLSLAHILLGSEITLDEENSPLNNPKDAMLFFHKSLIMRALQAYFLIQYIHTDQANSLRSHLHAILSGRAEPNPRYSMATWLPHLRDYYFAYMAYQRKDQTMQQELRFVTEIQRSEPAIISLLDEKLYHSQATAASRPPLMQLSTFGVVNQAASSRGDEEGSQEKSIPPPTYPRNSRS